MKVRVAVFMLCIIVVTGMVVAPGCSKDESEGASLVEKNLNAISGTFAPKSLSYTAPSRDRNPCEGYDLFSCQPVLLRLYLSLGKQFFDLTKNFVTSVKTELDKVDDGTTRTGVPVENITIDFIKTSRSDFRVLGKSSAGESLALIEVKDTSYKLVADMAKLSEGETASGFIQIDISFSDDQNWTMTLLLVGFPCSNDDARAPESMRIRVHRVASVWNVNAQLYNGLWLNNLGTAENPTCASTKSDGKSMLFYTRGVADDVAAKANVYAMQRNKSDLSDVDNQSSGYQLSRFCNNYLGSLGGCASFPTSAYANPFCNPDSTDTALWADSCASHSPAVSAAEFPALSEFTTPLAFYQATISLPSSL